MNKHLPISLTGDRPTGPLHIGHLVGSLLNRVAIQDTHQSFIMIADARAYTDNIDNKEKVQKAIFQVVEDYLSVGIDPSKTTIFLQSAIPELFELTFYFTNFVTVSRLERNPTIRHEIFQRFTSEKIEMEYIPRNIPTGFLIYPISQAADILAFNADIVPVGEDQLPMIEQANEIAASFNRNVGQNILKTCSPMLSSSARLPGIDGNSKMGKSLGNTLNLNATNDEIIKTVKKMYTDPNHLRISDPGKIEGNTVFSYLDAFHHDKNLILDLKEHYQRGGLGDSSVKKILSDTLLEFFDPIQKRRALIEEDQIKQIIKEGTFSAKNIASNTVNKVKKSLGLGIHF